MTSSGWRPIDQVRAGESVLTLDTESGKLVWSIVEATHELPAIERNLLSIESATHSSLTTEDHRWWVDRRRGESRFRRSYELRSEDRIPTSAPYGEALKEAFWSDEFVELVAWFWTEGSIVNKSGGIVITQSHEVNPSYCERIRSCLWKLFGEPVKDSLRGESGYRWREATRGRNTDFRLNAEAGSLLLEVAPNRVVDPIFLQQLTDSQLDLFVQASVDADGARVTKSGNRTDRVSLSQKADTGRIDSFQIACVLNGMSVNTSRSHGSEMQTCSILTRDHAQPFSVAKGRKNYQWIKSDQPMYCITTSTGTWVARRHGSIYVTGNCVPLGIPHSRFKSWKESDQDKALAYTAAKAEVCEMCGSREADWVDPETGRISDHPHLTPTGIRCHGCTQIAQFKSAEYGDGMPDGIRVVLWEDSDIDSQGRILSKVKRPTQSD